MNRNQKFTYYGFVYNNYKLEGEERLKVWLDKKCKYYIYAHTQNDIRGLCLLKSATPQDHLIYDIAETNLPLFVYKLFQKIYTLKHFVMIDPNYVESTTVDEKLYFQKRKFDENTSKTFSDVMLQLNMNE